MVVIPAEAGIQKYYERLVS